MDPRKPAEETNHSVDTALPKRWSHAGAWVGVGFVAGSSARNSLYKSLFTGALLVPSLSAVGFFSGREFVRRDGPRRVAELKESGMQKTALAREYVAERITSFRK